MNFKQLQKQTPYEQFTRILVLKAWKSANTFRKIAEIYSIDKKKCETFLAWDKDDFGGKFLKAMQC